MPRLFDILRNKDDDKNNRKEKKPQAGPKDSSLNFPHEILKSDSAKQNKESEDYSLVSKKLIFAVKTHGVDNEEKAQELYGNAIQAIKVLLEKIKAKEDINSYMEKIRALLDNIYNQLVLGDSILENIYEKKENEYYLPYHIVNVLILSFAIGLRMGFNKSRMDDLGMAAIFYDVGLDELKEIIIKPRKLTEEERCWVEAHIAKSLKILEKVSNINEVVKEAIQMHHERINGKGYPRGIKAESLNPYARILGLIDTYEAIANGRPYIEGMNPHRAVKFIIGSLKDYFDSEVMKVFIDKMSVYPIGSIIRLDTQELARVISVPPGSPLRPVVMIIRGPSGDPAKERTVIDLSKQDYPSIQESI
jgi:HD-GYP domain-containing protein (c-di-GMP phosphodiesterase class II)